MSRAKRIDAKHRCTLRIEHNVQSEISALAFRHRISLNCMYNEMLLFALQSQTFHQFLNRTYVPDERHGHFVYIQEGRY